MKKIVNKIKDIFAKIGTLNIILVIVGAFFLWFNFQMIEMYNKVGSIPESYACAVIAATIGECGICGWIRTNKDKRQTRMWTKQDRDEINKGGTTYDDSCFSDTSSGMFNSDDING